MQCGSDGSVLGEMTGEYSDNPSKVVGNTKGEFLEEESRLVGQTSPLVDSITSGTIYLMSPGLKVGDSLATANPQMAIVVKKVGPFGPGLSRITPYRSEPAQHES